MAGGAAAVASLFRRGPKEFHPEIINSIDPCYAIVLVAGKQSACSLVHTSMLAPERAPLWDSFLPCTYSVSLSQTTIL